MSRGVSRSWYDGFLKRSTLLQPKLCMALVRNQRSATLQLFNSTNYKRWYEKFVALIVKERFATRSETGSYNWTTPERVIIFDETCVSGALTQKAAEAQQKGLTIDSRLEKGEKSGKYRRATLDIGTTEEHITGIMGHTLSFQPIVPIWIVSSENRPSNNTMKKIEEAAPKGADLPVRDNTGAEINDVIIGWSKKGGVARVNIDGLS